MKKSIFLTLFTIPLTILAGIHLLNDRQFLIISALVLLQVFLPFFLLFEGRKPATRTVVMLAVLCALAVAGRGAFFWLPQVSPTMAMVIIAGVAMGAETGFLVGAMTMLASNLFMGQGPWTPWQMLAMGLVGLLAGAIFYGRKWRARRLWLVVFGVTATVLVFGAIMNVSFIFMFQGAPTWEMLATAFVLGLPFDLVHAVSTGVFLFFLAPPFLEKIARIKTKFGIFPHIS